MELKDVVEAALTQQQGSQTAPSDSDPFAAPRTALIGCGKIGIRRVKHGIKPRQSGSGFGGDEQPEPHLFGVGPEPSTVGKLDAAARTVADLFSETESEFEPFSADIIVLTASIAEHSAIKDAAEIAGRASDNTTVIALPTLPASQAGGRHDLLGELVNGADTTIPIDAEKVAALADSGEGSVPIEKRTDDLVRELVTDLLLPGVRAMTLSNDYIAMRSNLETGGLAILYRGEGRLERIEQLPSHTEPMFSDFAVRQQTDELLYGYLDLGSEMTLTDYEHLRDGLQEVLGNSVNTDVLFGTTRAGMSKHCRLSLLVGLPDETIEKSD